MTQRGGFRSVAILSLALLLAGILPSQAQDDGPVRNVMLIVDASGSM
jgi:hypothetical protein